MKSHLRGLTQSSKYATLINPKLTHNPFFKLRFLLGPSLTKSRQLMLKVGYVDTVPENSRSLSYFQMTDSLRKKLQMINIDECATN